MLYWYRCSDEECDYDPRFEWGSQNFQADREWCACNSPKTPTYIGYGTWVMLKEGKLII